MQQQRLEPACGIIKKLGGEAKVAEIVGTGLTTPYSWQYPRENGGTDGLIPQRHHPKLLNFARENGLDLKAEDFLPIAPSTSPADHDAPTPAVAAS